MKTLQIVLENWDTVITIIGAIIAIIRLTAWGKANKEALDTIVGAIEDINSAEVKEKVKSAHGNLNREASNALTDSVRRKDKNKTNPGVASYVADVAGVRPRQNKP